MSFIKKAVKKVFKGIKKVVKTKAFKYLAIATAVFFTAGVAAGGFGAFTAAANTGLSGFFTAVGQTIATGASAIAGGLGMTGVSSSLAAHGGMAAVKAGLVGAPGWSVLGIGKAAAAATAATGGGISGVLGGVLQPQTFGGQLALASAVGGIKGVVAGKAGKQKYPNGYVAGGVARGGSSEAPTPYTFEFGEQPEAPAPEPVPTPQPTQAGAMAQQDITATYGAPLGAPDAQPAGLLGTPMQGVMARLARRDALINPDGTLPSADRQEYAAAPKTSLVSDSVFNEQATPIYRRPAMGLVGAA